MANDVKEIEYLAKQLEGIMQSVSTQNWDDVADSWFNLVELSHGECTGSRLQEWRPESRFCRLPVKAVFAMKLLISSEMLSIALIHILQALSATGVCTKKMYNFGDPAIFALKMQ